MEKARTPLIMATDAWVRMRDAGLWTHGDQTQKLVEVLTECFAEARAEWIMDLQEAIKNRHP